MFVLCMMAKAPVAGEVKTRMCPPLSAEQAAALAAAFVDDSWAAMQRVANVHCTLAYAGELSAFPDVVADAVSWPQTGDDLGQRIANVLRRGLQHGDSEAVLVIGSDAPGLPARLLDEAKHALVDHDAVLGPADDGGYYLIGSRHWREGMLDELPWSSQTTLQATTDRLRQLGLTVKHISQWFDVDDEHSLRRLAHAIGSGEVQAPATKQLLREWQWR